MNLGGLATFFHIITFLGVMLLPLSVVSAWQPWLSATDFTDSSTVDRPEVSAQLTAPIPSQFAIDLDLVEISSVVSSYGSTYNVFLRENGTDLARIIIPADKDLGASNGYFGQVFIRNGDASIEEVMTHDAIPEGTRIRLIVEIRETEVEISVVDQADDTIITTGVAAIAGLASANEIAVQTYDNEGTIAPVLVDNNYWVLRATRDGVDTTAHFYGVEIPGDTPPPVIEFTEVTLDGLVASSGGKVTGTAPNYQLHDNIFIAEDETLVIPAGTTITRDDGGSWPHFIIKGQIVAQGTETSPILITSGGLRGANGDYDRALEIHSTVSSESVLEWVIMEKADYGLFIKSNNQITLKNCIFRDNNRGVYACGLLSFESCTFKDNGSSDRPLSGAGIYIDDEGVTSTEVLLSECTIQNNHAYDDNQGGGIYLAEGYVTVSGSILLGNSAKWGGGVSCSWMDVQSHIQVLDSTIQDNSATDSGGGIFMSDDNSTESSVLVSGCLIRRNFNARGAGIYLWKIGSPIIESCEIYDNQTTTANSSGGGVEFNNVSGGGIYNCEIRKNKSQFGAGVMISQSVGILVEGSELLYNSVIDYDLAYNGSGIHVEESSVEIQSLNCTGNVFFWKSDGRLTNSTVGTVGMSDSSPYLGNNVFGFWSDLGLYFWGSSAPIVENNIFGGYVDLSETEPTPLIRYNCFYEDPDAEGVFYDSAADSWHGVDYLNGLNGGSNNFSADPLLASDAWDAEDYHLKSIAGRWDASNQQWVYDSITSPCIDAGNPESDYFLEAVQNGGRINIGPYGGTSEASRSPVFIHGTADNLMLRWMDRYDGETGYNIYRSGSATEKVALVGNVSADVDHWSDSSAELNQTYYYRIYPHFDSVESADYVLVLAETTPGEVHFESDAYSVAEEDGTVTIQVRRTGGLYGNVVVAYSTADLTALASTDYIQTSGQIMLAHGETSALIEIPVVMDAHVSEGAESFEVSLEVLSGMTTLGAPNITTITIIDAQDLDGDGMPDQWELENGLDTAIDDSDLDKDEDGLTNSEEAALGSNPDKDDSDNDGLLDVDEVNVHGTDPALADTDGDGRKDGLEINTDGTNPLLADTDTDGLPDGWEIGNGLDPLIEDSADDPDLDELTNLEEFEAQTDPNAADTDGDEMPDGWEVSYGLDPLEIDSWRDADEDSIPNAYEWAHGTSPRDNAQFPDPNFYVDGAVLVTGDGSFTAPFMTIKEGLTACTTDWEIVKIASGTYTGSGNKKIDYGGRKVMLLGESGAVIDCENDGYAMRFTSSEGSASVLYNLCFKRGSGEYGGGGAIYCVNAGPSILRCTFAHNSAQGNGGAIWLREAPVIVSDCAFLNNYASRDGGALCYEGWVKSDVHVEGSKFSSNVSGEDGGAIYIPEGSGMIVSSDFSYNSSENGGAISIYRNSGVRISECRYTNNAASGHGGALFNQNGSITVENSLFVGNQGILTGGIAIRGGELVHCTVYSHDSIPKSLHQLGKGSDLVQLKNSIFYEEYSGNVFSEGSLLLRTPGSGRSNIFSTPELSVDYSPMLSSPCVDGVVSDYLSWDIRGFARPILVSRVYSSIDVGCYEYAKVDSDGDGLSYEEERLVFGTDPNLYDTDGDGLCDLEIPDIVSFGSNAHGRFNVPEGGGHVVDLSLGGDLGVALYSDGSVKSWGSIHVPHDIPSFNAPPVQVDAGWLHGVALLENGRVSEWGHSGAIYEPDERAVMAVAAGSQRVLLLLENGILIAYGVGVPVGLTQVMSIDAGGETSFSGTGPSQVAFMADGEVRVWGVGSSTYTSDYLLTSVKVNRSGEVLGLTHDGKAIFVSSGQQVVDVGSRLVEIEAGLGGVFIGVDEDGRVFQLQPDSYVDLQVFKCRAMSVGKYYNSGSYILAVSLTDPLNADSDDDGLLDGDEAEIYGTYPINPDSDGDGIDDGVEVLTHGTSPILVDTDSDSLSDFDELNIYYTNPLIVDTDGDNLSDGVEVTSHSTNPLSKDTDGDEIEDNIELSYGLDPNSTNVDVDTDSDGLDDAVELLLWGSDPTNTDSDSDGLIDGVEVNTLATSPVNEDSDGDSMPDGWEVDNNLLPLDASDRSLNPDRDNWLNWREYEYGLNPQVADLLPDTDGDSLPDQWELDNGLLVQLPSQGGAGVPVLIHRDDSYLESSNTCQLLVIGDALYSTAEAFKIYDITNQDQPMYHSALPFPINSGKSIHLDGDLLFVSNTASSHEFVAICDVSDEFAPTIIGSIPSINFSSMTSADGFIFGVFQGDFLYSVSLDDLSSPSVVEIVDMSNVLRGPAVDIQAIGNNLFVCASGKSSNLLQYRFDSNGNIEFVAEMARGSFHKLIAKDELLFAVGGLTNAGISSFFSNESGIYSEIDELLLGEIRQAYDVSINGNNIYMTAEDRMFIYSYTNGGDLQFVDKIEGGGMFGALANTGYSLYTAGNIDNLFHYELFTYKFAEDIDNDGLEDLWEQFMFGNLAQDSTTDYDEDGLLDWGEYQAQTDPTNPDSDGDGLQDGWEMVRLLNPLLGMDTDHDEDGLWDWWEVLHGIYVIPDVADFDIDGDGYTTGEEYVFFTDPTDPSSRFNVLHYRQGNALSHNIGFDTMTGRTYCIEYRDSLTDGDWEVLIPEFDGSGSGYEHSDSTAPDTQRFYRVKVSMAE